MKQKGFTLLEIMIAVAILTILVAIAIPNYQVWVSNQRLRSDMAQLEGDLQAARMAAINRSAAVTALFNTPAAGQYVLFVDNGAGGGTARDGIRNGAEAYLSTLGLDSSIVQARTLSQGIVLSQFELASNALGSPFLLFNGKGIRRSPLAGNPRVELGNVGNRNYCIRVTLVGDINVSNAAC